MSSGTTSQVYLLIYICSQAAELLFRNNILLLVRGLTAAVCISRYYFEFAAEKCLLLQAKNCVKKGYQHKENFFFNPQTQIKVFLYVF